MRTKDGLKLIIDRAQYLKASKSFKKSFSQNTLQTVLPSLRIFLGYFLLRYVWNFIFALSRTIIIFSTSNSTEKLRGKKTRERKYLSWHGCAPFSLRLQKFKICFSLNSLLQPATHLTCENLPGGLWEIQSCTLSPSQRWKSGERTNISKHGQRKSWSCKEKNNQMFHYAQNKP